MKHIITAAFLASSMGLIAAPAAAQDEAGDKVNMVIVYGEDQCPASTDDVINVCARKAEGERFRIPENLRISDNPENKAWAERVDSFEMIGTFGALSCSPTGASGFTGCTDKMIKAAYGEKGEASSIRFGQLIDEARAQRLAAIDEEAAETQARVEQLERAYMEKLERERDGADAGAGSGPDAVDDEPLPQPTASDEIQ